MSATAPIMIDCEASNTAPRAIERHCCTMCGQIVSIVGGLLAPHQRPDILAMIDRGDFG
jgi:hypothetical protein